MVAFREWETTKRKFSYLYHVSLNIAIHHVFYYNDPLKKCSGSIGKNLH